MEIVYDDAALTRVMKDLTSAHGSLAREGGVSASRPILIDSFLEDAIEVDVDAVRDATATSSWRGSWSTSKRRACTRATRPAPCRPRRSARRARRRCTTTRRRSPTRSAWSDSINVQYAVKDDEVFVLEANPRASRTVPFVAKATGVRARPGRRAGHDGPARSRSCATQDSCPTRRRCRSYVAVKEAVLPFSRFPGVDTVLGPEMRSTGEVMGIGESFGIAFAKSQLAAGTASARRGPGLLLPRRSRQGGRAGAGPASSSRWDFASPRRSAPPGYLRSHGVSVETLVGKVGLGDLGVDAVKMIATGEVQLVVNTPSGSSARSRRCRDPHGLRRPRRCRA